MVWWSIDTFWLVLQIFAHMQRCGVDADVVTCCSLISALERGGQWHLAQQLFLDMCRTAAAAGSAPVRPLLPCLPLSLTHVQVSS